MPSWWVAGWDMSPGTSSQDSNTPVWWAEAHPLCDPTLIRLHSEAASPFPRNQAGLLPISCRGTHLRVLYPRQPHATQRCCCLKSTDPCLGGAVCIQNLLGETVTHSLPAVPNSCSLSVPEPFSTARQGYRLAQGCGTSPTLGARA